MQMRSAIVKISVVSAVAIGSFFVFMKPAASGKAIAAVDGAEVYAAKCAGCHGKDGKGNPRLKDRGIPDFTSADWQKNHTDAQIKEVVENGKAPAMPKWKGKLSDDDITSVVGQLRAFGPK